MANPEQPNTGEIDSKKKVTAMGCVFVVVPGGLMAAGAYAGSMALSEREDPLRCVAAAAGGGLGFAVGTVLSFWINKEIQNSTLHL